jgi:hypothetical protein
VGCCTIPNSEAIVQGVPLNIVLAAVVLPIPKWCKPHLMSVITLKRNSCKLKYTDMSESVQRPYQYSM